MRLRRQSLRSSFAIRLGRVALQLEWDPEKAASNLFKHSVSFEGASTVSPILRKIVDDARYSVDEKRYVLLGHSERERVLAIMFTDKGEPLDPAGHSDSSRTERV